MAKTKEKRRVPVKPKKSFAICPSCGKFMLKKKRLIQNWGWTFLRMCENQYCPDYKDPTKTIPPVFNKKDIKKFPELKRLRGGDIIINGVKAQEKRRKKEKKGKLERKGKRERK